MIDIEYFKDKLLAEQDRLIDALKTIGRINPDNPKDWEAVPNEDKSAVDSNDRADNIEQYEQNTATLKELENELNEVKEALRRIENGNYGICEKTKKPIPKKRLEAYPAARTCL